MNDEQFFRLKEATARVVGAGSRGTGYLVAPGHVATCQHVVEDWEEDQPYEVFLGPERSHHVAYLEQADPERDAAILRLEDDAEAEPLPLANAAARRDMFESYGYPRLADEAGIPFDGVIQDPDTTDQDQRPALLLFSQMVAAGQASPLHGFSGSPVLVDGAVVGHLTRHLGDPDDRTRASYGTVYAAPIAAVHALLEGLAKPIEAELPPAPLPAPPSRLQEYIEPLGEDRFHVFLSYRSKDREMARHLATRMEGAGYRVFYDQWELKPGDDLVNRLESGLERSEAAVVLVSHSWLASPWCKAESSFLTKRAIEDESFRLIPVRIDDCEIPGFLSSRLWIDLHGTPLDHVSYVEKSDGKIVRSDVAEKLDKLLWAIIGKSPPRSQSAKRLLDAETDVSQEFIVRLRAATKPKRVFEIWREWSRTGLKNQAPALVAAEALKGQGDMKRSLEILDALSEPSLRAKQLRALALRKLGRRDEAIEILQRLLDNGALDAETGGLLAGAYKEIWRESDDRGALNASFQLYRETWERTGDPFNGINAAATGLWAGQRDYASATANSILEALGEIPGDQRDHWYWATLGEAYLLADRARDFYRQAVAKAAGKHEEIAVMRRQARTNLEYLGREQSELDDVLPVPTVVAFFGHMLDKRGREPARFPRGKIRAVRAEIKKKLKELGLIHAFCSAARGSDIIFLEELLKRGGMATIILPYPVDHYRVTSLGGDWNRRFDNIVSQKDRVDLDILDDTVPTEARLENVLTQSNIEIQERTAYHAKLFGPGDPKVIAVWDRKSPGDGPGGTADAVDLWEADGYNIDVIDITKL